MAIKDFAIQLLNTNPNIRNNPQYQNYISIIQNGDSAQGEQIANNLCNTFGVPKEKALQDAKRFFNIP